MIDQPEERKLQKGDRVKYTGTNSPEYRGKCGEVLRVEGVEDLTKPRAYVRLDGEDAESFFYSENLTLLLKERDMKGKTKHKFKKKDRVKYIGTDTHEYAGKCGEVKRVTGTADLTGPWAYVRFDGELDECPCHFDYLTLLLMDTKEVLNGLCKHLSKSNFWIHTVYNKIEEQAADCGRLKAELAALKIKYDRKEKVCGVFSGVLKVANEECKDMQRGLAALKKPLAEGAEGPERNCTTCDDYRYSRYYTENSTHLCCLDGCRHFGEMVNNNPCDKHSDLRI